MSEWLTGICLPGVFNSRIADWGKKTPAEMVAQIRRHAEAQKAKAEAILAAKDEDFHIDTYKGPWARRNRTVLQQGRKP